MELTALHYLIIAILSYYLVKGLIFLLLWQTLVSMEEKGKQRKARAKKELEEKRKRRDEFNSSHED